jgi:hypothetical protein
MAKGALLDREFRRDRPAPVLRFPVPGLQPLISALAVRAARVV